MKYTKQVIKHGIGTSNGFEYDVFEGGYIRPSEILIDKDKARKIEEAIELIGNWKLELEEDGVLNIF